MWRRRENKEKRGRGSHSSPFVPKLPDQKRKGRGGADGVGREPVEICGMQSIFRNRHKLGGRLGLERKQQSGMGGHELNIRCLDWEPVLKEKGLKK